MRGFLNGTFQNTAFCLLAPDGEERLTRAGRGPQQVLGGRPEAAYAAMEEIREKYREKGKRSDAQLSDFNNLKQAVNVASADQRVLVVIKGEGKDLVAAQGEVAIAAWDEASVGRYFYDTLSAEDADTWKNEVGSSTEKPGIYLLQPDAYGISGDVVESLPLDAGSDQILAALGNANSAYAEATEPKVYNEHVTQGRRAGIKISHGMPYGEDRDGDGVIDHGGPGKRPN